PWSRRWCWRRCWPYQRSAHVSSTMHSAPRSPGGARTGMQRRSCLRATAGKPGVRTASCARRPTRALPASWPRAPPACTRVCRQTWSASQTPRRRRSWPRRWRRRAPRRPPPTATRSPRRSTPARRATAARPRGSSRAPSATHAAARPAALSSAPRCSASPRPAP
ncbi:hypothetical protein H4R21_005047, partial [Coemansia helicoidea]